MRWPVYSRAALNALADQVSSQSFIDFGGNEAIGELEKRIAAAFGRRYALAVNSGTSALLLSHIAQGLQPGQKVLCPAYTFYGTVTSLLPVGLDPILVDLDPRTLNIDLADARRKAAGALLVTHNWGNVIPYDELARFSFETGLPVIEDASHLGGQLIAASSGRARLGPNLAMSLGERKMVSGGAGGVMMTDSLECYERAIRHGWPKRRPLASSGTGTKKAGSGPTLGYNFRISALSAELVLDHLRHGETHLRAWEAAAMLVIDAIGAVRGIQIPTASKPSYWYKVPIVMAEGLADWPAIEDGLRQSLDVTVDPASTFVRKLPKLAQQVEGLPNWCAMIDRIATIDMSRLVARHIDMEGLEQ